MKGFLVKVIYDTQDHSRIAIQEDQMFPEGVSREQAEQLAERRKQAATAAAGLSPDEPLVLDARAARPSIADELKKLADLCDRGMLTEAEFEAQKARVLAAT
jgi:hypothetical protein